jgi:hypothetical protein
MDIIENGLAAGATLIGLSVLEDRKGNWLQITITDNGRGISEEMLEGVMDPFITSRTTRRVGLGLSLFREASRRCDGEFNIESKEGEGTEVFASFRLNHIDLAPLGDMAGSLTALIMGNSHVDFVYTHQVDDNMFQLDTRQIKEELDGVPLDHPEVITYLASTIRESLADLNVDGISTAPLGTKTDGAE